MSAPSPSLSMIRFKPYMFDEIHWINGQRISNRHTVFSAMSQVYCDKISSMIGHEFDKSWIKKGFTGADRLIIDDMSMIACTIA